LTGPNATNEDLLKFAEDSKRLHPDQHVSLDPYLLFPDTGRHVCLASLERDFVTKLVPVLQQPWFRKYLTQPVNGSNVPYIHQTTYDDARQSLIKHYNINSAAVPEFQCMCSTHNTSVSYFCWIVLFIDY
jgi:hypothetical protein